MEKAGRCLRLKLLVKGYSDCSRIKDGSKPVTFLTSSRLFSKCHLSEKNLSYNSVFRVCTVFLKMCSVNSKSL